MIMAEENYFAETDQASAEETGESTTTGAEAIGSEAATEEDMSFASLQKAKGYKNADDLAKAYHHADKHIGTIQGENKALKEWQQSAMPILGVAKTMLDKGVLRRSETGTLEVNPDYKPEIKKVDGKEMSAEEIKKNEELKRVVGEIVGSKIGDLDKKITESTVKSNLDAMRKNKEDYPYMNLKLKCLLY